MVSDTHQSARYYTLRPIPDDFHEYAGKESQPKLMKRYGAGYIVVKRWLDETGLHLKRSDYNFTAMGGPRAPVPADFVANQALMSIPHLMAHYGVGRKVIRRWLDETGNKRVRPAKAEAQPDKRKKAAPAPLLRPTVGTFFLTPLAFSSRRDLSPVGRAAEFMQRDRPVFRCDERGQQAQNGRFWMCGRVRLTDDELIERAEAKGFQVWSIAA